MLGATAETKKSPKLCKNISLSLAWPFQPDPVSSRSISSDNSFIDDGDSLPDVEEAELDKNHDDQRPQVIDANYYNFTQGQDPLVSIL